MNIIQNYLPKGVKRDFTRIVPEYLTIHSTANPTSTAQNERDYLTNPTNTTSTGWHVCVDEHIAICAIPLTERAWHAGDGYWGRGNNKSIALEICESGDRETVLKNASIVGAMMMIQCNIPINNIREHGDWALKNCPRILRDTGRVEEFKGMIKEAYVELTKPPFKSYTDLGHILWDIDYRLQRQGIEFDSDLWHKRAEEDKEIYWLMQKTLDAWRKSDFKLGV